MAASESPMLDKCGMNNQKILLAIVVLVIVASGWLFLKNKKENVAVSPTPTPEFFGENSGGQATPTSIVTKNVVIYTDSGYAPNIITIKKGETVVWKNESSNPMWTASAMHPTHKVYPGTDITACGTQTLLPMFDSCASVSSDQSWSFTFNNIGTWGYHNHLDSSKFGKVIVE